jgi:hypothetical protein
VSEGLGDRGRSEASKTSVDLLHLNEGAGSVSGLAVCIFVPLGGDAYERQLTGEPSDQQVDADVDLPRDPGDVTSALPQVLPEGPRVHGAPYIELRRVKSLEVV